MAIYRFDSKAKDVPIAQGQWICPESMLRDMHCSEPRLVTKVSGERVYWERIRGKGEFKDVEEGYIQRKSVVYVADTEEEARRVFALEKARLEALTAVYAATNAQFDAQVNGLLTKVGV